jgi:hypothetical protein
VGSLPESYNASAWLLSIPEPLSKVVAQGIPPDGFNGSGGLVGQIVLAATGGFSEIEPVGGLVAGSTEKVRVDKSLEPVDGMGIDVLPILTECAGGP